MGAHEVVGSQRLLGGSGSQTLQVDSYSRGLRGEEDERKGEAAIRGRRARSERICILVRGGI